MTRLLLTLPEAAEALAISRSKLYELLASGAIASLTRPSRSGSTPM
ncbi:MAG TPA: helix-turn-helix domain-containing protein [Streptosporangiaceae bacterium]|nr:helix-turn-helix domain-containing protein [Streptosporangiaceae bacterium]